MALDWQDGSIAKAYLWLILFGIALGVATYSIDPLSFIHPVLAVVAIGSMVLGLVLSRTVPALRAVPRRARGFEVAAMFVYTTLLTASTGATNSPFIPLYALSLTAAALIWKRWQVASLAVATLAVTLIQSGFLDAMNDMFFATTAAVLFAAIGPAAAAALIIATMRTQVGQVQTRAEVLATLDTLTGLYNMQSFEQQLLERQRDAERNGQPFSVLVADIDELRLINETLGHEAGSRMIAAVAKAITRAIRNSDHAARMGGDVFVVLLADADASTAAGIAQRVRNNVYNGTLMVENRMLRATVSLGSASFPRDAQSAKEVLIVADQRMQQDKSLRRRPASAG